MTADLDDLEAIRKLDSRDILGDLRGLPVQCREAWTAARDIRLPGGYEAIERIVIAGMGGSAIAGDFLRALLQRESAVPVFNARAYELPPFVDERTLVIASSFSGDTEETLSAFARALASPAKTFAITTGGKLLTTARANGVPAFTFGFDGEPRSAIGWSLMPLLAIASHLGLMHGIQPDVEEAIGVLEHLVADIGEDVPLDRNSAKQMAAEFHERLPVVYGAGPLVEVARRWKTQLNESGKTWAFFEELPEAHHNAVIGYGLPSGLAQATTVVLLRSAGLVHPRVQLRYDLTRDLLERSGVRVASLEARGLSGLAQMLSLSLFGDYVSAYLAFLYGEDPSPTTVIDELKGWLKEKL